MLGADVGVVHLPGLFDGQFHDPLGFMCQADLALGWILAVPDGVLSLV
jgi:hypothetical protein